MGLACKCPISFLYDQTREFTTIVLGIFSVSDTAVLLYQDQLRYSIHQGMMLA